MDRNRQVKKVGVKLAETRPNFVENSVDDSSVQLSDESLHTK